MPVELRDESFELERPDGVMDVFATAPAAGASAASVLLYFDNPGMRESVREIARRIAGYGFRAIAPDLYYRDGRIRLTLPMGAPGWQRVRGARDRATLARFADDLDALLERLDATLRAGAETAAVGICIGSGYALAQRALRPERTRVCALLDGCEASDRVGSPLPASRPASAGDGPLPRDLAVFAGDVSPGMREALLAPLSGTPGELEVLELAGTEHGYLVPDWVHAEYDPEATARTFDALARTLRGAFEVAA